MMLECCGVTVHYGAIEAVHDVNIRLEQGDIVSVIGANGAGKTTLLRSIMGLEPLTKGLVRFRGTDISRMPPHDIVRLGLSFVPAGGELFRNLSVVENLRLGAVTLRGRARRAAVQAQVDAAFELFPVLADRRSQKVRTMSGGEQQMVAIARALMIRPKAILLDEPSFGLAPMVLDDILATLRRLNDTQGLTILLVEQNARLALDFAGKAYILAKGRVVAQGPTSDLREQAGMASVYFGGVLNE